MGAIRQAFVCLGNFPVSTKANFSHRDEHYNRSPECPFFTLIDEHNSEQALKKSTTAKKGRISKASRLSTQSAMTVTSDAAEEEGDSIISTATTKGKTSGPKGRKTQAKKAEPSRLSIQSAITIASDATAEEGDSIMSTATTKAKTSALKGRKAKSKKIEPIEVSKAPATSTTRGRKRKSDDEHSDLELPNPGPKRRTTRASTARVIIPQASAAPLRAPTFTDLQAQAVASDLLWMEGSPPQSPPPLSPPQSLAADSLSDTEPQSSDAENHLPEKPNTPPNQNQRFMTPKTAKQWEPIDAEIFFGDEQHEHFVAAMAKLKTGTLSNAESQMSVEQWIYYTAEVAQEKLRDECERMVADFEAQGLKALACLEGIEVV